MKTVNQLKREVFANKHLWLEVSGVLFTNEEACRWLFNEPLDDTYHFEYPTLNMIRIWK